MHGIVGASPLHITYATREYRRPAKALLSQSETYGFRTRCYTPRDDVVRQLSGRFPTTMRARRGAGYWLWKPAIILDALSSIREDDVLLYTDAGVGLLGDPRVLFSELPEASILLFDHPEDTGEVRRNLQRQWTKRDCFALLSADSPEFWQARQLSASFLVCRNDRSGRARRFIRDWLEACSVVDALDDSSGRCGKPEFPDFVAHRHDQSILTIVAQKSGIRAVQSPAARGQGRDAIFDHYRRRPGVLTEAIAPIGRVLRPRTRLNHVLNLIRGTQ